MAKLCEKCIKLRRAKKTITRCKLCTKSHTCISHHFNNMRCVLCEITYRAKLEMFNKINA